MYKIINQRTDSADYKNNSYIKCSCLRKNERIEIPRPNKTGYVPFVCPNCGEILGVIILSKEDFIKNY